MADRMVTIIADASFCHQTKITGWAGRVICNDARKTYSGVAKRPLGSSNDAEMVAVVNTVVSAYNDGLVGTGMGLLLQTDNMHVVFAINTMLNAQKGPKMSDFQKEALQVLSRIISKAKPLWVKAKHCKGHVPVAARDKRHHVQESLDHLAKYARISSTGSS